MALAPRPTSVHVKEGAADRSELRKQRAPSSHSWNGIWGGSHSCARTHFVTSPTPPICISLLQERPGCAVGRGSGRLSSAKWRNPQAQQPTWNSKPFFLFTQVACTHTTQKSLPSERIKMDAQTGVSDHCPICPVHSCMWSLSEIPTVYHFSPLRAHTHPSRLDTFVTFPGKSFVTFCIPEMVQWLSQIVIPPLAVSLALGTFSLHCSVT